MIYPSEAWQKAREQSILPETFVEISMNFEDAGAAGVATVTGTNEATFSETAEIVESKEIPAERYAFLEQNMWLLDGSKSILEDLESYDAPGYVTEDDSGGGLTVSLSEVRTSTIPGITITWSTEQGEYATEFTVKVMRGAKVVASTTVTNNTSLSTFVDLPISNYDSVVITVTGWSIPDHRFRIENVKFGHTLVFDKTHILSYTHEQSGDFTCTELPKNSIEFAIDNSDDRWNPLNQNGFEKYLSERLKITVRYGMDLDGVTEWIPGGVFYLSEWRAPSNGLEATFAARDALEFMLNTPYNHGTPLGRSIASESSGGLQAFTTSKITYKYDDVASWNPAEPLKIYEHDIENNSYRVPEGWVDARFVAITTEHTFDQLINKAVSSCGLSSDFVVSNNSTSKNMSAATIIENKTVAELIQLICNAGSDALILSRDGQFKIGTPRGVLMLDDYTIPLSLSYSYPEIELSKPLKAVILTGYGGVQKKIVFGTSGETVEVENPLVVGLNAFEAFSKYYKQYWNKREVVSGEFRGDPVLDVFDAVSVETKFGTIERVVLTHIKYTYNGNFHCSYTGRVM